MIDCNPDINGYCQPEPAWLKERNKNGCKIEPHLIMSKIRECPHCYGKGKRPYVESGWGLTDPKDCWQCEGTGTNKRCLETSAEFRCGCKTGKKNK